MRRTDERVLGELNALRDEVAQLRQSMLTVKALLDPDDMKDLHSQLRQARADQLALAEIRDVVVTELSRCECNRPSPQSS